MLDEVREVKPGLYLGLGTVGPFDALRNQPFPFLLRGPYNRIDPREAPAIVRKAVVVDGYGYGYGEGEAGEGVGAQLLPPLSLR